MGTIGLDLVFNTSTFYLRNCKIPKVRNWNLPSGHRLQRGIGLCQELGPCRKQRQSARAHTARTAVLQSPPAQGQASTKA